MAMSRDRILFRLAPRYFDACRNNGMNPSKMQRVLQQAFNMNTCESHKLMSSNSEHGFHILCRPSQFARFIVLRMEVGCIINGIKDLKPRIVDEEQASVFNVAAREIKHKYGIIVSLCAIESIIRDITTEENLRKRMYWLFDGKYAQADIDVSYRSAR